jgi:hypothetical protein
MKVMAGATAGRWVTSPGPRRGSGHGVVAIAVDLAMDTFAPTPVTR